MMYLVLLIRFPHFRIGGSSRQTMVSPIFLRRFRASVILAVRPAIRMPLTVRLMISESVAPHDGVRSRMIRMIASVWLS
jgi:hypothetical protein